MALKKIASLWKPAPGRTSKTVLSGKMEDGRKVLMFANTDKGGNEKRPDFTLHIAEDDQPGVDTPAAEDDAWGSRKPADFGSDDVPF